VIKPWARRTSVERRPTSALFFVPLGGDCLGSWLWTEPQHGMRSGCWAGIGLTQLAASQRSYFWIIGTRARNTLGCSKIRFYWHRSLLEIAGKQDGFGPAACQKSSNSRRIGDYSKVPKFQKSTARGGRPRRRIGVERRTGPLEPASWRSVGGRAFSAQPRSETSATAIRVTKRLRLPSASRTDV